MSYELFGGSYKPFDKKRIDDMYLNDEIDSDQWIKINKDAGQWLFVKPVIKDQPEASK